MFGTYSTNSTSLPESFLGGVSQTPSITPCNPNQLVQQRHSQTSAGVPIRNYIFDRESGKPIIIQSPSFDLMMSDSSLSLRTDWKRLPQDKLIMLIKCLLLLQTLPEASLEEAADELEGISSFYSNRLSQTNSPMIPASSIKGKLRATQVRPAIVLEP